MAPLIRTYLSKRTCNSGVAAVFVRASDIQDNINTTTFFINIADSSSAMTLLNIRWDVPCGTDRKMHRSRTRENFSAAEDDYMIRNHNKHPSFIRRMPE